MAYSVDDIVQALNTLDREGKALDGRLKNNRQRAQRLINIGEVHDARGEHAEAESAYRRAVRLQPSLAVPKWVLPNTPFSPPHPFDVVLKTEWQRYGFVDPREPDYYRIFMLEAFLRERREGKPEGKLGYGRLKSPEEVLQKYPLAAFREWLMRSDS